MQNVSQYRRVSKQLRQTSRCSSRSKSKNMQRTEELNRNNFLNHRFTPIGEDKHGLFKNRKLIEQAFFTSVENICSLYGINKLQYPSCAFPLNILLVYEELRRHLSSHAPHAELIIADDNTYSATLSTVETLTVGNNLYYIPIRPLLDVLQNKDQQAESEQLLFIFSYLYHVVDIPWLLNCGNFMEDTYDCLESWFIDSLESGEQEDFLEKLATIKQIREYTPAIEQHIQAYKDLHKWRHSINKYKPVNSFGKELRKVAILANDLYTSYPNSSILHSVIPDLLFPEQEERMRIDHYLTFFWDGRDCLYDDLIEFVNVSFQEYGVTDEPVSVQSFALPQITITHSLDFENRLFSLIDELCTFLNNIP